MSDHQRNQLVKTIKNIIKEKYILFYIFKYKLFGINIVSEQIEILVQIKPHLSLNITFIYLTHKKKSACVRFKYCLKNINIMI